MEKKYPNLATVDAMSKCEQVFGQSTNVLISISGGADSDVMLDLIYRQNKDKYFKCNIHYVFFDTGIEMKATKEHLDFLENKYNIKIERVRAKTPVPLGCKKNGLPFLNKDVSKRIKALQNNNFDFANDGNKTYEELIKKYPRCKSSLDWWCNKKPVGGTKMYNINKYFMLKEFMVANPPTFIISDQCCYGAKKSTSHLYEKYNLIDLRCVGLRRAEGGARQLAIKGCFSEKKDKTSIYRPIFWFTDKDKKEYEEFYNIVHSKCYTEYGFKRTGCCGCPFNSKFEEELEIIKEHEPMLNLAVNNIFGKSYEYTLAYRKFKKEQRLLRKQR